MSMWSCACHNGMTGAGSDRDVGPTPVQRARFQEYISLETSKSQDLLATTGMYPTHIGLAAEKSVRVLGNENQNLPVPSRPLPPSNCFPSHRARTAWCSMSRPSGFAKTDRAGISAGHGVRHQVVHSCNDMVRSRYAAELQSVHHATMHEGLIETCRSITGRAEDPSHTARESGQRARFPDTAHGRSMWEPRLCRDLQVTRWG